MHLLTPAEFAAQLQYGGPIFSPHTPPVALINLDAGPSSRTDIDSSPIRGSSAGSTPEMAAPLVVIGLSTQGHTAEYCDVICPPDDPQLSVMLDHISEYPIAAVSLALLLRSNAHASPTMGIVNESATYSMLQGSRRFQQWLRTDQPGAAAESTGDPVIIESHRPELRHSELRHSELRQSETHHSELHIVLNRPNRHNAIDRGLRLALHDALQVAALQDPDQLIVLRGHGPSFSSGGDLGDFGGFQDSGESHLVRLHQHPALALLRAGTHRVEARVHGAVMGGGLELAAFADRVIAHPDAVFSLPELALGLVPGAGGTVSIPQRIGRQRTMAFALHAGPIDAPTARQWGLIDEIDAAIAIR